MYLYSNTKILYYFDSDIIISMRACKVFRTRVNNVRNKIGVTLELAFIKTSSF